VALDLFSITIAGMPSALKRGNLSADQTAARPFKTEAEIQDRRPSLETGANPPYKTTIAKKRKKEDVEHIVSAAA